MEKVSCKTCKNTFESKDIIATREGLYCSDCLPEDVIKTFFTVNISWAGVNALVAVIDGDATADQLMIADKVRDKLALKIKEAIEEILNGIQKPNS